MGPRRARLKAAEKVLREVEAEDEKQRDAMRRGRKVAGRSFLALSTARTAYEGASQALAELTDPPAA